MMLKGKSTPGSIVLELKPLKAEKEEEKNEQGPLTPPNYRIDKKEPCRRRIPIAALARDMQFDLYSSAQLRSEGNPHRLELSRILGQNSAARSNTPGNSRLDFESDDEDLDEEELDYEEDIGEEVREPSCLTLEEEKRVLQLIVMYEAYRYLEDIPYWEAFAHILHKPWRDLKRSFERNIVPDLYDEKYDCITLDEKGRISLAVGNIERRRPISERRPIFERGLGWSDPIPPENGSPQVKITPKATKTPQETKTPSNKPKSESADKSPEGIILILRDISLDKE